MNLDVVVTVEDGHPTLVELSLTPGGQGRWHTRCVPSYRFSAAIGALRPGVAAARLLPEVTDDARTLAIVEASSIAVVRGEARVVIRFTGDDDPDARSIALGMFGLAGELAELSTPELTRRVGTRWVAVTAD